MKLMPFVLQRGKTWLWSVLSRSIARKINEVEKLRKTIEELTQAEGMSRIFSGLEVFFPLPSLPEEEVLVPVFGVVEVADRCKNGETGLV